MNEVEVERKSYQMPPQEGFTVAHFLTVADVERSLRFYGSFEQFVGRNDRMPLPSAVLRKVQMDI
jgi:hypothetical protein